MTNAGLDPLDPLPPHDPLDRLARRRASAKLGWYIHAVAYATVNLGLVGIAYAAGRHWAVYPVLGWGLGLALHGAAVWLFAPGGDIMDRMVRHERRRLEARR